MYAPESKLQRTAAMAWFQKYIAVSSNCISILLHAEFGLNDHREDAPRFSFHVLLIGLIPSHKESPNV